MSAAQVQAYLRQMFRRWGLPRGLRLDNGLPWGSRAEHLPTGLALWLVGLGLELTFNPARQPRYNGVVEKGHETSTCWTEPHLANSVAQWQQRCDEMDQRQREKYPYLDGRSRLEVFPQLQHSGRRYSRTWEEKNWSLLAVQEYLRAVVVRRRVSARGRVCLYNRERCVSMRYAGEDVWIGYDPDQGQWLVSDRAGGLIDRLEAGEINQERIVGLTLASGEVSP